MLEIIEDIERKPSACENCEDHLCFYCNEIKHYCEACESEFIRNFKQGTDEIYLCDDCIEKGFRHVD